MDAVFDPPDLAAKVDRADARKVLARGRPAGARQLGRKLRENAIHDVNHEIWNGRQFDKIPEYFAEEFVSDYSPTLASDGRHRVQEAAERSHAAFEGSREDIKTIVAGDERVAIHFTIKGKHTGQWGPLPATGKEVAFGEIVIMTVRDGKVVHQAGVIDNLTGLRQVDVVLQPPVMESGRWSQ